MAKSNEDLELYKEVWSAVWHNHHDRLKQLLDNSFSATNYVINLKHDSGKTLLHTAAMQGHIECTKLLLSTLLMIL